MKNEKGLVLIATLALMAILALVATVASIMVTTEVMVSSNYRSSTQAFYDAEAGVQYTLYRIEGDLDQKNLSINGSAATESVSYAAPVGFSFGTITEVSQVGTSKAYQFEVTGNSTNSSATLKVVFERAPTFQFGIFGEESVDMKASSSVYSYNSVSTPTPNPADYPANSTGEGDIGSNENVTVHNGTYIDGDVGLGDDDAGTEGVYNPSGTPIVIGDTLDVDRIDPDPLGAVGGSLALDIIASASTNNNASIPQIVSNAINLGNGETATLTAGVYYLSCIDLNNGATLNIDATGGKVTIYIAGDCGNGKSIEAKTGSNINITGMPTIFIIYSNSTSDIIFKHNSEFRGAVYAPYAGVEMKNSADAFCAIFAKTVDVKNSGNFYFDTALRDEFPSNNISIVSWKEVRN